jgi:outer membrane biosynthesis protein TonB
MIMATKNPTAVAERRADAPDVRVPDFFVYTDAMKAHEDNGDGRPTVLATASSTAVDLEADRFTANALKQMKEGFVGKLIFLNHSYKVPQDVFGLVQSAELVKREGRLDLDMVIGVEMNNPLAVQTYQYVVNGTRMGVSVGVIVTEAEKSEEEDEYGKTIFDISGVIPLEASVVGIPANQTAWTRQAIKSLFERGALDLDDTEVEARPWLKTVVQAKEAADAPYEELEIVGRGAVGSHSTAKAPRARSWQSGPAVKRLRSWAGGPAKEDINWGKYKTGFTWFDAPNKEGFGAYKLPHHDIVNSSLVVVFRGAVAAAVVIQGGRGGVNIPEGDMGSVKAHIAKHYHQFDEKAPWEREKSAGWLDIELEAAADLQIDLPDFTEATWPEDEKEADMAEQDETKAEASEEKVEDSTDTDDTQTDETDESKSEDDNKDESKSADEVESESEEDDEEKDAAKSEDEEKDENVDETEADESKTEGEKKDDFEDDVAADEAADLLIDKMYTGFRVALSNLIGIILNTDLNSGERAKAGAEVIDSWKDYIEESWGETIEHLDESKDVEPDESFNVSAHLHDLIAEEDGVECNVAGFEDVAAKVKEIGDAGEAIAEDNTKLREKNEQYAKAIKYMEQVMETLMQLPLQTVTTRDGEVAQSLAARFPLLDTRVVERMARFAPTDPQ